jgi:protein SCO1/2
MTSWNLRSVVKHSLLGVTFAVMGGALAFAQPSAPLSVPPPGPAALAAVPILKDAGLEQKPNSQVPLDAPFVDEHGKDVRLGDYFGQRPVILVLAYYECPMLCTQVLNGVAGSLQALPFEAGRDFDVLAVSFDPGETPAMALAKREAYLKRQSSTSASESAKGVHFLTGREPAINALTEAVGFKFKYDPSIDQYAHPAVVTILTPEGRVSRYLFGIEYGPKDLRMALVEAANHRIGSVVDQVLLFCYHYDPERGTYGFAITNLVRLGGIMTVAALGTFILVNLRRDRRQDSAVNRTATGNR